MASIRNESLLAITDYHQRNIEIPKRSDGKPYYTSEYFGQNVFTIKDMERTLPKSIFQKFIQQQKVNIFFFFLFNILFMVKKKNNKVFVKV